MTDRFLKWLEYYAPHLIAAAIILVLGFILTKIVIKIMSKGISKRKMEPTAHSFLMSIVKVTLYVIIIIMVLSSLQVPMSSIIAAVGAAGVAIALALQNSLSNVAGGFLIMFTRPFKCGDFVDIGGVTGNVSAINILYTKLLTMDNKAVFIPNGSVSNNTIINYTNEDYRRLEMYFSISYESDFSKARQVLNDILSAHPYALEKPQEPLIVICEHAESSVRILLRVWVKTEHYWDLNYDLLEQVKTEFAENGIEIPYNKLDVNITNKDS